MSVHRRTRRTRTPRMVGVQRSVRSVGLSLCVTRSSPWSAPRGNSPLTGESHRLTPLVRRPRARRRPPSPIPRPCREWTLVNRLPHDAPGYKSHAVFSPRTYRAPPAAIDATPVSPFLRLHPEPMGTPSPCPRTSWSSHRRTLPCPTPILTGIRAPVAAPPLLCRTRSPEHSLPSNLLPIDPRWA
jgi:hypothetical protein